MNISTDGESEILTGLTFINVTRKKSKKPKKKKTNINKTREHLLILINNELITHLHEKSHSKVNHKTLADIEKEYNENRVIRLKTENYSPSDIYIRGEQKTNTYFFNVSPEKRVTLSPEVNFEKLPDFCRKSLARRKIRRFTTYLKQNLSKEITDNDYDDKDQGYMSDESLDEDSEEEKENEKAKKQGFFYLRNLSRKLKSNKKTLAKKNTMAFGNHHNNKQSKALTSFSPIKEIDY